MFNILYRVLFIHNLYIHIYASDLSRILWIVCVFGAVFLFGWHVTKRSMDYFEYATSTDLKVVLASELDFPAVTICNLNNFR